MELVIIFYILFIIFFSALLIATLTGSKILKDKKDAIIIYSIGTIIYGALFVLTLRLQLNGYNYVHVEPMNKTPINNKTDISNNDNTDNKKDVLKKNLKEILKGYKVKDIAILTLMESGYEANIQIELDQQITKTKEGITNEFNTIEKKVKPIISKYKIELDYNSKMLALGGNEGELVWGENIFSNASKTEEPKKQSYVDKNGNKKEKELIKGNINKNTGEKIYHVPGSTYYDRTIAEEWFNTIEEAEKAGYRAPKR